MLWSNARCLFEDVDVPALDGIAFIGQKKSNWYFRVFSSKKIWEGPPPVFADAEINRTLIFDSFIIN